jgi:hypothetical protein
VVVVVVVGERQRECSDELDSVTLPTWTPGLQWILPCSSQWLQSNSAVFSLAAWKSPTMPGFPSPLVQLTRVLSNVSSFHRCIHPSRFQHGCSALGHALDDIHAPHSCTGLDQGATHGVGAALHVGDVSRDGGRWPRWTRVGLSAGIPLAALIHLGWPLHTSTHWQHPNRFLDYIRIDK